MIWLIFIAVLLLFMGFIIGCWYMKMKLNNQFKKLDFGLKCVSGYEEENIKMLDRLVELEEMFQDDGGIDEEERC